MGILEMAEIIGIAVVGVLSIMYVCYLPFKHEFGWSFDEFMRKIKPFSLSD